MKEQRQMRQANNAVQQQFNSDNTLKSNNAPHSKYCLSTQMRLNCDCNDME